jgi:hypothetical protein
VPDKELKYETSKGLGTFSNNNRLKVFYLASNLQLNSITLMTKASFSQNFGSYGLDKPPLNQLNLNFDFRIPLKSDNSFVKVGLGIDHGQLVKDNYGVNVAFMRFWQDKRTC